MLAIKIRKVEIPALNDAKYVSIVVYVSTALFLIVLVASLSLAKYPNTYAFIYSASSIIGGATFLGLLFVPKVTYLLYEYTNTYTFFFIAHEEAHKME